MADKVEYSRLLIKRSDNSGVIPTTPTGSTLSTFTDTDTFVGEFFLNSTDDRLWVRTDNGQFEIMMSGNTSGNTQNLSQTLIYGNETLGNDIIISQDDRIYSFSGSSYIELNDNVGNEIVKLYTTGGTDDATFNLTPTFVDMNTSSGDVVSSLELDPSQSNNGTILKTIDTNTNDFSVILVRETDLLLEVSETGNQSSIQIEPSKTTIDSPLTFLGDSSVGFWTQGVSYTTTGAGATIVSTIDTSTLPFGNNRIYKVICHWTAFYDTYVSGMTTEVRGTFMNNGGTLTQIGAVEYFGTRNGSGITSLPDFTITGSGINLRVRGVAITNINWSCVVNIQSY